jgi:hypothetical protein
MSNDEDILEQDDEIDKYSKALDDSDIDDIVTIRCS